MINKPINTKLDSQIKNYYTPKSNVKNKENKILRVSKERMKPLKDVPSEYQPRKLSALSKDFTVLVKDIKKINHTIIRLREKKKALLKKLQQENENNPDQLIDISRKLSEVNNRLGQLQRRKNVMELAKKIRQPAAPSQPPPPKKSSTPRTINRPRQQLTDSGAARKAKKTSPPPIPPRPPPLSGSLYSLQKRRREISLLMKKNNDPKETDRLRRELKDINDEINKLTARQKEITNLATEIRTTEKTFLQNQGMLSELLNQLPKKDKFDEKFINNLKNSEIITKWFSDKLENIMNNKNLAIEQKTEKILLLYRTKGFRKYANGLKEMAALSKQFIDANKLQKYEKALLKKLKNDGDWEQKIDKLHNNCHPIIFAQRMPRHVLLTAAIKKTLEKTDNKELQELAESVSKRVNSYCKMINEATPGKATAG